MSRSRIGSWLFGAALVVSVGCGRKDDPGNARPEDAVALSKPAAETSQAASPPDAPRDAAGPENLKESGEVVADDAPVDVDDGDGEAREGASKRKRGKSRRSASRKRASNVAADEQPEDDEPRAVDGAIRLKRIQFTHSIEGREPVDPEETFAASETDKLYAFLELTNDSKQKGKVVVTFIPPMGASSKVTLNVGSTSRWRTWALRKSPKAVGSWKVIVADESGREIGHRTFEVTQ